MLPRIVLASVLLLAACAGPAASGAEEPPPLPEKTAQPDLKASEPAPPAGHPSAAAAAAGDSTLDLGGGISMELVSIPAGSFKMGATEKVPESPSIGFGILLGALSVLVLLIVLVGMRAMIARELPRFSLAVLVAGTLSLGLAMLGLLRWRKALAENTSSSAQANERPEHLITLNKAFLMGRFCVTQQQFEQIMRANYSYFKAPDKPAENVSWDNAAEFCSRVSTLTGRSVRLPTEAEWEYACRAGSSTLYFCGDDARDLFKVAWYAENSKNATHSDEESLKDLKPNAWGLFDMHGNVMQWCQDWYDAGYYAVSPPTNPTGPAAGSYRVVRGSAWLDTAEQCRAAARNALRPDRRSYCLGFRVVVEN